MQNKLCKILLISIYSLSNISCSYNFVWLKLRAVIFCLLSLYSFGFPCCSSHLSKRLLRRLLRRGGRKVGGGFQALRNPDRPFLATLPSPHHHQPGPCPGPQTIQWAGQPYNAIQCHTMGRPTCWLASPHTLQWRPQFTSNLTHWKEMDAMPGAQHLHARCSTRPHIQQPGSCCLVIADLCVPCPCCLWDGRTHASYGWEV